MKYLTFTTVFLIAIVFAITFTFGCAPVEPIPEDPVETVVEEPVEEPEEPVEEPVVEEPEEPVEEPAEDITIGYAAPWLRDTGQVVIMQGLLDGAMDLGWRTVTTNADGDVSKQINDIDNLLTMEVDAIVTVPEDSAAIVPAVERANAEGVPVFTIDRSALGGDVVLTVLADNYIAGSQAGEFLVERLTEKYGSPQGKVLELQGDLATNVAQLRGGGFNDVLAEYPDITVIQQPTDWDPVRGGNATEDVLTTDPDLDAIYFHSEFTGTGVISALERVGRLVPIEDEDHIIVIGIDGTPEALDWIRDGYMDGTAAQPLYDYGIVCAQFIQDYLEGREIELGVVDEPDALWSPAEIVEGEVGLELQLSTTLVTRENVDDERLWGNVLEVD